MRTSILIAVAVAMALVATPIALANPGGGNSWFGLCTAYNNNGNGQENGNPENAPPFQQLAQQAEDAGYDSVEEFCSTVPHPGSNGGGNPGNGGGNPGNGGGPPF